MKQCNNDRLNVAASSEKTLVAHTRSAQNSRTCHGVSASREAKRKEKKKKKNNKIEDNKKGINDRMGQLQAVDLSFGENDLRQQKSISYVREHRLEEEGRRQSNKYKKQKKQTNRTFSCFPFPVTSK